MSRGLGDVYKRQPPTAAATAVRPRRNFTNFFILISFLSYAFIISIALVFILILRDRRKKVKSFW